MALVYTTKGELEEATLEKREGVVDDDRECTRWIEYWLDGELVHRSVHIVLKKAVSAESAVQGFE